MSQNWENDAVTGERSNIVKYFRNLPADFINSVSYLDLIVSSLL